MAIDAALGRLGSKAGVCTSTTRPVNPFEGQVIFETDTNRTLVYDNAAWLVVADNQVLSIDSTNGRVGVNDTSPSYALDVTGDINATNLRLSGNAIGIWIGYTPTLINWTASSIGFAYSRINNVVFVKVYAVVATMGNYPRFSLPPSLPVAHDFSMQRVGFLDVGANWYDGALLAYGSTECSLYSLNTFGSYGSLGAISSSSPFTWVPSDAISGTFVYGV